nr:pirin-like C-terminal cupin domain-containing protein [Neisseria lisongii]
MFCNVALDRRIRCEVQIDGQTFTQDELAKFEPIQTASRLRIHTQAGSHIMLLGGEPLPHPTLIWWNFVADHQTALEKAVADWNSGHPRFGNIDISGTTLTRLI